MKSVFYSLVALTIISSVFMVTPALAQEASPMTDDHITRIKANCQSALTTLSRIHANDAPTYVNRNQVYYSVSDKLMARLNSRLALNSYDSSQMVKTTAEFNKSLVNFRKTYKEYDDTVSDLIRIDCRRQPVGFYDKVAEAREQREKVHAVVQKMQDLIGQYRESVQAFRLQHFTQSTGAENE